MNRELLKEIYREWETEHLISYELKERIRAELAKPEPLSDDEINEVRYKKLRRWMSSNVREGWQEVKNLAAIAAWEGWDAFDSYLDEIPECNVGLCQTGETP